MNKIDLRDCSDQELSLIVMNDESLYLNRHRYWFIDDLREMFLFTDAQLEELKNDLEEEEE